MFSFTPTKKQRKDSYNPPVSVAENHLKVMDYLGDGVFLRSCGGLGVIYELQGGIYDEPLLEKDLALEFAKYDRLLRDILPGFPQGEANTVVQFICSQRKAPLAESYSSKTKAGQIIAKEAAYVQSLGLISRRYFITILWREKDSAFKNFKESLKASFSSSYDKFVDKMDLKKKGFLAELRRLENTSEATLSRLNDKDFIFYCQGVLQRGISPKTNLGASAFHNLGKNLLTEDLEGCDEGFDFPDGGNIRHFYLPALPEYFAKGRLKTFMSQLPTHEFDLVWTMGGASQTLRTEHFARLLWFSQGPAYQKHKADLESLRDRIGPLNPYGKLNLSLTVFDCDEDSEVAITKAATIYLGASLKKETRHGPQMIMRSMPLNCGLEENAVAGRFTTKSLDTALGFLPIYDGPGGEGMRVWMNNRGFPTRFNLFKGEQNRTTILLGRMGAGKSVTNGSLILEFMERFPDGIVRVVDKKSSYAKLCDLMGGKLVKFSAEEFKKRPYSPFAVASWGEDDIELVSSFIANAIVQVNPDVSLGAEHTEILNEALRICANNQEEDLAWQKKEGGKVHAHFTWDEVKTKLERAAEAKGHRSMAIVDDLRRWTTSFDKTGSLGFLFTAREEAENLSDTGQLIVYDLDDIHDERLKNIAAQLVAMKVTRDIKKFDLGLTKLVQFEELGVYLEGENEKTEAMANRFVMNITKTIRKMNGIPFGITNAVEDFFQKKGGKSFWKQSTQKIFLPFTDDMVSSLEQGVKEGEIKLTAADIDIIRNLHIKDGEYSQAYIISENSGYKGVINMPLSPVLYALLNTSPSQNSRYQKLRDSGSTAAEAIDQLAEEFSKKRSSS